MLVLLYLLSPSNVSFPKMVCHGFPVDASLVGLLPLALVVVALPPGAVAAAVLLELVPLHRLTSMLQTQLGHFHFRSLSLCQPATPRHIMN